MIRLELQAEYESYNHRTKERRYLNEVYILAQHSHLHIKEQLIEQKL